MSGPAQLESGSAPAAARVCPAEPSPVLDPFAGEG